MPKIAAKPSLFMLSTVLRDHDDPATKIDKGTGI
jgi:hypothetical protein